MQGKFLFLGTGASMGVPVIGCSCAVCLSQSPFNQRYRSAGWIEVGGKSILIDVGPDLRMQVLSHGIKKVDGVLITHTHFDHIGGIDELRAFHFLKKEQRIPLLLSQEAWKDLCLRYPYLMPPYKEGVAHCAQLDFEVLEGDFGKVIFQGIPFRYLSYKQAGMQVIGYCLGNFAYISDIRAYDEVMIEHLQGVELLVLSALRWAPSPMHLSIEEALLFSQKVGAKTTWLTHLSHEVDHDDTSARLRDIAENVFLGYDGLQIEFSGIASL